MKLAAGTEPYIVRVVRIPEGERDVAGPVLAQPGAKYTDIFGSDDAHDPAPFDHLAAYVAHLTLEQAERFRQASNCLTVEPDYELTADLHEVEVPEGAFASTTGLPEPAVLSWVGVDRISDLTGVGTIVAILDGGMSPAVRMRMGNAVLDEWNFSGVDPGPDGVTTEHGCMVGPCAVPSKAGMLDYIISNDAGTSRTSAFVAAVRRAVDHKAKVIIYSYSGGTSTSAQKDAARYAQQHGALIFCSAGNDGQRVLGSPSDLSRLFWNVISSIASDYRTDTRPSWSNYYGDGSGCAPGAKVQSLNKLASVILVSGTSFSNPFMGYLAALLMSGGTYTAQQVSDALKATARRTAAPTEEDGLGGWNAYSAFQRLANPTSTEPDPPAVQPPWWEWLRQRWMAALRVLRR